VSHRNHPWFRAGALVGVAAMVVGSGWGGGADGALSASSGTKYPDASPHWSPDGKRFAFVRVGAQGREVWVAGANGSGLTRVGPGSGFVWSPRSDAIAYQAEEGRSVLVATLGQPSSALTRGGPFSWAPDGRALAVQQTDSSGLETIVIAQRDGSPARRIAFGNSPQWSPAGRTIAFVRQVNSRTAGQLDAAIFLADVSSGSVTRLTGAGAASTPTWSPDGRSLAYVDQRGAPSVKLVTLSAKRIRTLGPGRAPLVWAPRGGRLAYGRAAEQTVTWRPGGRQRSFEGRFGSWAPDGLRLILEKGPVTADGIQQLFRANVAQKRVVRIGYGWQSDWRPTGELIAFARKKCGRAQGIFTVSSSGATLRKVIDNCTVRGTTAADVLQGSSAVDFVLALEGADVVTPGAGLDRVDGGPGSDRIDTRDGVRDEVTCGTGNDTVTADPVDLVAADCESMTQPG